MGNVAESKFPRPGRTLPIRAQWLYRAGPTTNPERARMPSVGKSHLFGAGVRDQVEGGRHKGFLDALQNRAQAEIECLQKTAGLMHHRSKFFKQGADNRGDQCRAQSVCPMTSQTRRLPARVLESAKISKSPRRRRPPADSNERRTGRSCPETPNPVKVGYSRGRRSFPEFRGPIEGRPAGRRSWLPIRQIVAASRFRSSASASWISFIAVKSLLIPQIPVTLPAEFRRAIFVE